MNKYTKNQELNREILIWINERILSLLDMYLDMGNDTEWDFEYLYICFPRNYIEDNETKECLRVLNDIYDILKSSYIQKNMKLLYKYVLIKLIEHYQVLYEDAKMCKNQDLCDIYFSPVEEVLAKKIYSEFGYEFKKIKADDILAEDENHPQIFIEMSLEDIDGLFWDDVFDDTEIDIDWIDQFVEECIDKIKQGQFVQWDLDNYLDLISRGVKERYQKVKPLLIKIQEKMTDVMAENVVSDYIKPNMKKSLSKDTILEDICTACLLLQGSEKNILKDENARNTYIRDILRSKGYDIADQTLRGESASRKRLGELDFEIMKTAEIPFAIYEALNLKSFSNSEQGYLISHLNKLLDNYNPMGIAIAFLVSYAKCTKENFDNYCSNYYKYLKFNAYKCYSIHSEFEHKQIGNYLRCVEYKYKCGETFTTVYHIVVRMNE